MCIMESRQIEGKLHGDAVRKEISEKMSGVDSEGSRLRQRQGMVRTNTLN